MKSRRGAAGRGRDFKSGARGATPTLEKKLLWSLCSFSYVPRFVLPLLAALQVEASSPSPSGEGLLAIEDAPQRMSATTMSLL